MRESAMWTAMDKVTNLTRLKGSCELVKSKRRNAELFIEPFYYWEASIALNNK